MNDSIAEQFVYSKNGAFAYIGNSWYGLFYVSEDYNEEFLDAFTKEGKKNLGVILQDSKTDLLYIALSNSMYRVVNLELNLLGDPETQIYLPQRKCTDSDGGKNYIVKGTINSTNLGVKTDACNDTQNLTEYYCNNSVAYLGKRIDYKCPNGCSIGACKPSACTDSDGGQNFYVAGQIISSNLGTKTDVCKNTTHLIEYLCYTDPLKPDSKDVFGNSRTYKCPNGCANRACKPLKCTDTDGGKNWYVKGTIYSNNSGTLSDACLDTIGNEAISSTRLLEYYCDNTTTPGAGSWAVGIDYTCTCYAGACKK
jgi:hypothetical protein